MKWLRKQWSVASGPWPVLVSLLAIGAFGARAELKEWVQNIEASSPVVAAFFRSMQLPGGPVTVRRPPKETRPELTKLIATAPSHADLIALRAHEAEFQLDFTAAEADWKRYAELAADRGAGELALADFYHRRLRPSDEVKTLTAAGQASAPSEDRFKPAAQQRSWNAFQRSISVVREQLLPPQVGTAQYRVWIAKYPRERQLYTQFLAYLKSEKQFTAIEDLIAGHRKQFPDDEVFPVTARASREMGRGNLEQALAIYDRAYQPLWPPELVKNYFTALGEAHALRKFLDSARAALAANPDDLNAASRIFHYYQQQRNLAAAQRVLVEFRLHKESRKAAWNANELSTLARLFETEADYNEAARAWYALNSLPGADAATVEKALTGITNVLLTAPEQPIRFGAGDLSFYRDVATMDPYPGFLNGILSLLLNSTDPASHYAAQETASVAYFHRARAAQLVALFDSRYPKSPQRPGLKSKLVEAYAAYGASDGVIKAGREFLAAFPDASERVHVSLLMADAYARKGQTAQEFAIYDDLLKELAARADGVPLGELAGQASPPVRRGRPGEPAPSPARSPEYARVLDRYISRLVSMKRLPEALALYRREIDRNPNDPGLYERLAAFLDQNRIGEQVEQVYRRAMQQFPGLSWRDKLARWYLRRKQSAEFEKLTQEVVGIFSGSELERYFRAVVAPGSLAPVLYRQVNLYAHTRFPHNLTFVKNLLYAYQQRGTADAAARERLLRENWFYDDELRARFFELLSATGRLNSELDAVRKMNPQAGADPAAAQLLAEAETWRSHLESAAPVLDAVAAEYPGNVALGNTAGSLERSLSAFDSRHIATAISIEENLHRYEPRNHTTLTRLGEIYADHDLLNRARPYWNDIPRISPGRQDGYLEAATIFWDYYLYDDALRLIEEGRKTLSNPALYAYEMGAVYENKRDYPHAIEEYAKGALAGKQFSPARTRLIELAKRPAQRTLVDQITTKLAAGQNPDAAAVSLRAAVLEAQDRRPDLDKFLTSLVDGTTSLELLASVDQIALRQGFEAVRERSLQRRIAITTDRVDRMRARLALMRYYEARNQIDAARRTIEALYSDNPTLLGVVRATVDFYWRNKMVDRAVDVLARAAAVSYPALKKQFTLEAALKATDAGNYQRARDLLGPLLAEEPFRGNYLEAMAETYARAGDYRALRDFYAAKIQAIRQAPLAAEERTSQTAALRRGLIPALTRLNDPAAAVDQYIEIIKAYPEDEALIAEGAGYAEKYKRQQQLRTYFTKAVADSPRDYRWPMVLARLETQFEDFPAAIAAYTKASAIRPDRTDLLAARATIEERLMRFDEAAATYAKLYDLTYHNPQWMEKLAETRARQGRNDDVFTALKRALLEGRADQAATRLEQWNMLGRAREFAERGVELAGANLLTDYRQGAAMYARIMTRLRQHETAFTRLWQASGSKTSDLLRGPLAEMGTAVANYYTPEEKAAFAAFLETQRNKEPGASYAQTVIRVAGDAGLPDLQARWLSEMLLASPGPQMQYVERELITLQSNRMKFDELGQQLEAYWKVYPAVISPNVAAQGEAKDNILDRAADAYRSAGNAAAELRVVTLRAERPAASLRLLQRYADLLVQSDPQSVPILAWRGPRNLRDAVANAAVESGNADLALRTVIARGRSLPPVWTNAYAGLVGLYYRDRTPSVNSAFRDALGAATIGERIGKPVDHAQQLAGDIWFYYGSRYGDYLAVLQRPDAEDYLPAELEQMPGNAAAYARLAKQSEDNGNPASALIDYEHALELNSKLGWVDDREAVILWQQGRRDDAIAHWKAAFDKFALQLKGRVPQELWTEVRTALEDIGQRRLLPSVREPADKVLRSYIHSNGSYRVQPLLEGAMAAAADPVAGLDWIIDLARSSSNPVSFLEMVSRANWIPDTDRGRILRRIVEIAREQAAEAYGEQKGYKTAALRNAQIRLATWLLDNNQVQSAPSVLGDVPETDARRELLEIRIATANRTLDTLLDRYRREPDRAPTFDLMREAAAKLRERGDEAAARRVLEFVYTRALEQRDLGAGNFLGLAEIRLETGDGAGALALLRRMTMVSGAPFENLQAAASLFEKFKRYGDATEFLEARVRAVPWDAKARASLASARLRAGQDRNQSLKALAAVAGEREALYGTRAAAALAIGEQKGGALQAGSAELDLLAERGPIAPARAEQPYFYFARVAAAGSASDPAARLRLLSDAIALDPLKQDTRLSLFEAALSAKRYQVAVSAMASLIETSGLRWTVQNMEFSTELPAIPEESWYSSQFLNQTALDTARRASVAHELAGAYETLGQISAAWLFDSIAVQLEKSDSTRAEIRKDLQRLKEAAELRAQNARRQPKVSEKLEQPDWVLPRLERRGQ